MNTCVAFLIIPKTDQVQDGHRNGLYPWHRIEHRHVRPPSFSTEEEPSENA
jgi:hypothetical protein